MLSGDNCFVKIFSSPKSRKRIPRALKPAIIHWPSKEEGATIKRVSRSSAAAKKKILTEIFREKKPSRDRESTANYPRKLISCLYPSSCRRNFPPPAPSWNLNPVRNKRRAENLLLSFCRFAVPCPKRDSECCVSETLLEKVSTQRRGFHSI